MSEADGAGKARQSSPRYPFITLTKALERAGQLRDAAGTNFALASDVRTAWGYGAKSSGGDQTLAALSYYGLTEDNGSGETRKIRLTGEAVRYLRDERPEVRSELAAKFVLLPKAMQALWNLWGHSPPSDSVARSILKTDLQYSDWAAKELLEVYKENLRFIPKAVSDKSPMPATDSNALQQRNDAAGGNAPRLGDYIQWTSAGVDQFDVAKKVTWISPDGDFVRVIGSLTGIPSTETKVVEPPAHTTLNSSELSVLMTGGRLQITADVDREGLERLKEILAKYEEILRLTGA